MALVTLAAFQFLVFSVVAETVSLPALALLTGCECEPSEIKLLYPSEVNFF